MEYLLLVGNVLQSNYSHLPFSNISKSHHSLLHNPDPSPLKLLPATRYWALIINSTNTQ